METAGFGIGDVGEPFELGGNIGEGAELGRSLRFFTIERNQITACHLLPARAVSNAIMDFIVADPALAVASNLLSVKCKRKFSQSALCVQVAHLNLYSAGHRRQTSMTHAWLKAQGSVLDFWLAQAEEMDVAAGVPGNESDMSMKAQQLDAPSHVNVPSWHEALPPRFPDPQTSPQFQIATATALDPDRSCPVPQAALSAPTVESSGLSFR